MRQPLRRLGIVLSLLKSHRLPAKIQLRSKPTALRLPPHKALNLRLLPKIPRRIKSSTPSATAVRTTYPEPHTKQVVRTSTNNVLSQQDAACASVTAQVAVSRECSLVLSKSPLSQALNRIYFPADVSGARHSANYYVYFEPASANHNQRPRLQKSNGRLEFNKLNDQLACVKLPLNEEKLKSLSSANQSTPPQISLHPQTQSISLL